MEHFLWTEKYRPTKIEDTILPKELKATFQTFIDQGSIPNLILSGGAGVGKTTVARAMLDQLDCDYIIINGSLNGNIDTLRNEISTYASAVSFTGKRKYVILDEADYLNPNSTQPALRNFMETFAKNCGFILTCNFINKIIAPLHSRCAVVDFKFTKKQTNELMEQFCQRIVKILKEQDIAFDKKTIGSLVLKYAPDWRRILNELQRYSVSGTIDSGILANTKNISITALVELMKKKDYTSIRQWVKENIDNDATALLRAFYDASVTILSPNEVPALVMLVAKYQYQAAFAADQEINTMAFLAECLINLDFK